MISLASEQIVVFFDRDMTLLCDKTFTDEIGKWEAKVGTCLRVTKRFNLRRYEVNNPDNLARRGLVEPEEFERLFGAANTCSMPGISLIWRDAPIRKDGGNAHSNGKSPDVGLGNSDIAPNE
jgi:hypothetical protein